ncbi:MAG: hypothetical protein AB1453_13750 [Chloroflexota bacterium]|jgi:hypothetical protein
MDEVLRFLKTYETWIYLLLAFAAFFTLRRLFSALSELRTAVFGLEKESAQRKFNASLSVFAFLLLLAAAEFVLTSIVFPDFPNAQTLATPTVELLLTPTATLGTFAIETAVPENGGLPALSVRSNEDGCVPGQIEWTSPQPGDTLQGSVTLRATISVPNLGFYKYEYNQQGSDLWVTIAAGDVIIIDQPLGGGEGGGQWNTASLLPGDYFLRLVVTDNVNNVFPACTIPVRIAAP